MLHGRDQYLLERYFSEGREERSNLGGILDHVERYSYREPRQREPEDIAATMDHARNCACPLCLHDVSARPTAEARQHAKEGPDDDVLALLGSVSRRLSVVRHTDPMSYLVLMAWFGDSGARYLARREGPGRLGALLVYTSSGKEIARRLRAKERGTAPRTDAERVDAGVAQSTANEILKQLVGQARVEAMALLERACSAWLSTAPVPHRDPQKTRA